jgi:shikimate dehydrogenase
MTTTGLVGYPVSHSLSPAIHTYWMAQHGIEGEYKLFTTPLNRLRQTMLRMKKKEGMGLNITVPHKEAVLEFLESVDAIATGIGAVNTITVKDGALHGTNTDAYGLMTNLREGLNAQPDLSHVVILGAGGAARAAIAGLKEAGAKRIVVLNRTFATAKKIADHFAVQAGEWDVKGEALEGATLLINTTSLGMKNQPPLNMSLQHLPTTAVVYDIVYNPLETSLLKAAKGRGNPTVDGLGMLLYQAQKAFALWHGITPEVTPALRAHVLAQLQEHA